MERFMSSQDSPAVPPKDVRLTENRPRLHMSPALASTPRCVPGAGIRSKRTRDMRSPRVPVPSRPSTLSPPSPFLKGSPKLVPSPNPRARKTVRHVLGTVETNLQSTDEHTANYANLLDKGRPQNDEVPKQHPGIRSRPRVSLRADASLVAQAKAHGWDRPLKPEPPVEVIWVDPSPKITLPGSSQRHSRRTSKTPAPAPRKSESGLAQAELPSSQIAAKARKPRHTIAFSHACKPVTPHRSLLPFMPAPSSPSDDPLLLKPAERPLAVLPLSTHSSYSRSTGDTDWAPAPAHGILASDGEDSDDEPEMSFTAQALDDMRSRTARLTSQSNSLILPSDAGPAAEAPHSPQPGAEELETPRLSLHKPYDVPMDSRVDDEWSSEPDEPWTGDVPSVDDDAATCFAASQQSATTQVGFKAPSLQQEHSKAYAQTGTDAAKSHTRHTPQLAPIYDSIDTVMEHNNSPAPLNPRSPTGGRHAAAQTVDMKASVLIKEEAEIQWEDEREDEGGDEDYGDDEIILIGSSFSRSMSSAPGERSSSFSDRTPEGHAAASPRSALDSIREHDSEQALPRFEQQQHHVVTPRGSELTLGTVQTEEPCETSDAAQDHQADQLKSSEPLSPQQPAHLMMHIDKETFSEADNSLAVLPLVMQRPLANSGVPHLPPDGENMLKVQSPDQPDAEAVLQEAEVSMAALFVLNDRTSLPGDGSRLPPASEGAPSQQPLDQPVEIATREEAEALMAPRSPSIAAVSADASRDKTGSLPHPDELAIREVDANASMASVSLTPAVDDISDVVDSRTVDESLASIFPKPPHVIRNAEVRTASSKIEPTAPAAPPPPPAPASLSIAAPNALSGGTALHTQSCAPDQSVSFAASLLAARSTILKVPMEPSVSSASNSASSASTRQPNFATWRRCDWNVLETHLIDAIEANPAWVHGRTSAVRSTAIKQTRTAPVVSQFLKTHGLEPVQLPQWSRKEHGDLSMALSAADRTSAHMPAGIPAWCERALSARAASLRASLAVLAKADVLQPGTMRSDLARHRRRSNTTGHEADKSRTLALHSTPNRHKHPSQRHPLANEITLHPASDVTQPSPASATPNAPAMPPPPLHSLSQPRQVVDAPADQSTSGSFLQEYRALVGVSGVLERPLSSGPVGPALLDTLATSKGVKMPRSAPAETPVRLTTEACMAVDESYATQGKVDMACAEFRPRFNRGSSMVEPTIICILGEAGLSEAQKVATQLSQRRAARQTSHLLAQRIPLVRRLGRPPSGQHGSAAGVQASTKSASSRAALMPALPTQAVTSEVTAQLPMHRKQGQPWRSPRQGRASTSYARIGSPLARSLQTRGVAARAWRSPLTVRRELKAAQARALPPQGMADDTIADRSGWRSPLTLRREQALATAPQLAELSADLSARAVARKSWRSPLAAKRRSLPSHDLSRRSRAPASASVSDRAMAFADLSANKSR